MAKRHVMIGIEEAIHDKARERGINISAVCEDTLRQVVGTFEKTTLPENCKHNWTTPFTVPFGLAKECKKCGEIKKVYVESYEVTMARCNK